MDSKQQQQQQPTTSNLTAASTPTGAAADSSSNSDKLPVMFRPPVNRAMRVLDRSFFRKTIPLSAATVFENSNISRVRNALAKSSDLLTLPRLNIIRSAPTEQTVERKAEGETERTRKTKPTGPERKCLILREGIKHDGGYFF